MNENETQTASAINYERNAMALAYSMLANHPEREAEIIARHYVAHATLALEILQLLEMRRYSADSGETAIVKRCVEFIKRNHKYDFGIPLEWKSNEQK